MVERIEVKAPPFVMRPHPGPEALVMVANHTRDNEPAIIATLDGISWFEVPSPYLPFHFANTNIAGVCFTGDRFLSYWPNDLEDNSPRQLISSKTLQSFDRAPDLGGLFQTDVEMNGMAADPNTGLVVIVGAYFRDPDFSDSLTGIVVSTDFGESFGIPGETLGISAVDISPIPDNIADALDVGSSQQWSFTCVIGDATSEPGETAYSGDAQHTIWFKWRSPGTAGTVTIDTVGSMDPGESDGFMDTVLTVYTGGPTIADLSEWTGDDDSGPGYNSSLELDYDPDTTYYIQASSYGDTTPGTKIVVSMRKAATSAVLGAFLNAVAVTGRNSIFVLGSDLEYNGAYSEDAGLSWLPANVTGINNSSFPLFVNGRLVLSDWGMQPCVWIIEKFDQPPIPVVTPWDENYPPALEAGLTMGRFRAPPEFMARGGKNGNSILANGRSPWTTQSFLMGSNDGGRTWIDIAIKSDAHFVDLGFSLLAVIPDEWDLAVSGIAWAFGYWWVSNLDAGDSRHTTPNANAPYLIRGSEDFSEWIPVFPPGLHDTRPGPLIGNLL